MEIYTKKILIATLSLVVIIFVLSIWFFELSLHVCLLLFFFTILFVVIILKLNKWLRSYLNPNVYPVNGWYRNHLERNYDCIILGNGTVNFSTKGQKVFDLRLHDQTLLWDFKTLKHFFSILKPGGKAVFTLSSKGFAFGHKEVKDLRPYYFDFMAYVFTKQHWRVVLIKVLKRFPILMLKPKDLLYYIAYLLGRNVEEIRMQKAIAREECFAISEQDLNCTIQLVKEIQSFCNEREIVPVFHIIARTNDERKHIDKILDGLTILGCELI